MRLGYNTNGFPQHAIADVCRILAELGYEGIAITPDMLQLHPLRASLAEARELRALCDDLGLAVAVETGARFLLDPRSKHQPTLLSEPEGARRRLDMLLACLELAHVLRAETLSFWSGSPLPGGPLDAAGREPLLDRLCAGANRLLDAAAGGPTRICFEPEPGMFVASLSELEPFLARLARPELLVMLDVGHVPVTESISPAEAVSRLGPRLGGLQLDDARPGRHEHLFPGEGVVDFAAVLAATRAAGFKGLACFELPRHAHDPVRTAAAARAHLIALDPSFAR